MKLNPMQPIGCEKYNAPCEQALRHRSYYAIGILTTKVSLLTEGFLADTI